eukprot:5101362-Pyramimonas_sp.AAC.1
MSAIEVSPFGEPISIRVQCQRSTFGLLEDAHSRLNAPQARNGAWYNLTISNGVQLSSLHLQQPLFTFKRPRPFRSTSPVPNSIPRAHYSQSLLSISPSNSIPHPA